MAVKGKRPRAIIAAIARKPYNRFIRKSGKNFLLPQVPIPNIEILLILVILFIQLSNSFALIALIIFNSNYVITYSRYICYIHVTFTVIETRIFLELRKKTGSVNK